MGVIDRARERWLRFAIAFAIMDLNQLGEGDWLNLRKDLTNFARLFGRPMQEAEDDATIFGVAAWPLPGSSITVKFTHKMIHTLQVDVSNFLHYSLDLKAYYDAARRGEDISPPARIPPDIHARQWLHWPEDPTKDAVLFASGELRDLFILRLIHLLQKDASHLRRCPECQTIFYRVRKQEYCSRRCTNRANMREWRKTPKGKARESDLNHSRYQARVRRTVGPKVTPDRRPRARKSQQED
jgi:endogenous inhibitor of DNA gyrase (YacG/DUF329 family)